MGKLPGQAVRVADGDGGDPHVLFGSKGDAIACALTGIEGPHGDHLCLQGQDGLQDAFPWACVCLSAHDPVEGDARADIVCRQLQLCRGDSPLRKAPGRLLPQAAAALEEGQEAIAGQQMQTGAGTARLLQIVHHLIEGPDLGLGEGPVLRQGRIGGAQVGEERR